MSLNRWNGKQVAEALRVPASKISRVLALLELPEALQRGIERGEIAARTAYELSKLTDVDAQRVLAAKAKAGMLSLDDAARTVRKRKGTAKPAPKRVKLSFPLENDWKVSVTPRKNATPISRSKQHFSKR
jgi:ParB family chromosome partitioning protein